MKAELSLQTSSNYFKHRPVALSQLVLLLLALLCASPASLASQAASLDTRLTWLPTGTVEVYAINSPRPFTMPTEPKMPTSTLLALSTCLSGPILQFDTKRSGNAPLQEKTLLSSLRGSQLRHGQDSKGSQSSSWHQVDIFNFKEPVKEELISYLRSQGAKQIAGGRDSIWKAEPLGRSRFASPNYYLAVPDDYTIMISKSSDQRVLLESLQRYHRKTPCAFSLNHPAWKHVNKRSDFWSIAFLPLAVPASNLCNDEFTSAATGVVAQFSVKTNVYQIACLTKTTNSLALVRARVKQARIKESSRLKLKSITTNVTGIGAYSMNHTEFDLMMILALMQALLCHQVILG